MANEENKEFPYSGINKERKVSDDPDKNKDIKDKMELIMADIYDDKKVNHEKLPDMEWESNVTNHEARWK